LQVAADSGLLGSIDANRGDTKMAGIQISSLMISPRLQIHAHYLEAGGFAGGGINFDAKIRRNSTDPADLFYAHVGGMDVFARALVTADNILQKSDYKKMRKDRYASFDSGAGKDLKTANYL
jgi:xylose isomerase